MNNIFLIHTLQSKARLQARLWNKTWVQKLACSTYQLGVSDLVRSLKHIGLSFLNCKWEQ